MAKAKLRKKDHPRHHIEQSGQKASCDGSIMGTNDSSTASKSSAERFYMPQPHYFRYFTAKDYRRAPLINRGYWLRMKAVEYVVNHFIRDVAIDARKVIVNLGCGFDTLPFNFLGRERLAGRDILFIDVDYPDLIRKKCNVILQSKPLHEALLAIEENTASDTVMLRSQNYTAIGCDLRDSSKVVEILEQEELARNESSVMFIAEVSLTYMDVEASNRLIQWSATLRDAYFCLLEQCLPNGAEHPFAITMVNHFEKLNTPLKSLADYPTRDEQERRFQMAGWNGYDARSLWHLWKDPLFLRPSERTVLNAAEAFDEWEDFALFASHYFCLVASSKRLTPGRCIGVFGSPSAEGLGPRSKAEFLVSDALVVLPPSHKTPPLRKYGVLYRTHENAIQFHGGHGPHGRLKCTDKFIASLEDNASRSPPVDGVMTRVAHTVTVFASKYDCLLVGGRRSPNIALSDCWLRRDFKWERVEDLLCPRYRHAAVLVTDPDGVEGVLVYGGKTTRGVVVKNWELWHETHGWVSCSSSGDDDVARFGANVIRQGPCNGYILGGLGEDGTIVRSIRKWSLHYHGTKPWVDVRTCNFDAEKIHNVVNRFGAVSVSTPMGIHLIGGISDYGVLPDDSEIVKLVLPIGDLSGDDAIQARLVPISNRQHRRLLLAGHSALWDGTSIAVAGGGAVCFSFGSFWNHGISLFHSSHWSDTKSWRHQLDSENGIEEDDQRVVKTPTIAIREASESSDRQVADNESRFKHSQLHQASPDTQIKVEDSSTVNEVRQERRPSDIPTVIQGNIEGGKASTCATRLSFMPVAEVERGVEAARALVANSRHVADSVIQSEDYTEDGLVTDKRYAPSPVQKAPLPVPHIFRPTRAEFEACARGYPPVLLTGLDVGDCVKLWTAKYLENAVGLGRRVIVHDCSATNLSLAGRNFTYETIPFGEFMSRIVHGGKLYLRSLSYENAGRQAANVDVDYPSLSQDFRLSPVLDYVKDNFHSSVLRICGPVNMGLHYDVMANVLCQILGRKTILLYPPSDVSHLGIAPGTSSSPIDAFQPSASDMECLRHTRPYEVILHPGDVLYIPPMWAHTASPDGEISVAVNVFFRNLAKGYAAGRDVYGNRDLQPYEDGRRDIGRLASRFNGLPGEIGRFYLERLAGELRDKALAIAVKTS